MHFMLKVLVKNCNDFRVITTLPPLEKSRPRDSKEAKVRKDIKEFEVRHFDQEFQSGQGDFESDWTRVSLKGECIAHKFA